MLLSAVSILVVAQSISEIPEGLMNNPVYLRELAVGIKLFTVFIAKNVRSATSLRFRLQ